MIDSDVRAVFAAIAMAHHGDRAVNGLFDHGQNRMVNITAVFDGQTLSAVNLERRARLTGQLPDFFDQSRSSYIHLSPDADRYVGYDHKTDTHLHLVIQADTVALYDHSAASWHQYSLKGPDTLSSLLP